jgi:hypothetical protein
VRAAGCPQQRLPLSLHLNSIAKFDAQSRAVCANLNEFGQHLEIDANQNRRCGAIPSELVHALTISNQLRKKELASVRKIFGA